MPVISVISGCSKRGSIVSSASTCPPIDLDIEFKQDTKELRNGNLEPSEMAALPRLKCDFKFNRNRDICNYPQRSLSTGSLTEHVYEELKNKVVVVHPAKTQTAHIFPLNGFKQKHVQPHRYMDMTGSRTPHYENVKSTDSCLRPISASSLLLSVPSTHDTRHAMNNVPPCSTNHAVHLLHKYDLPRYNHRYLPMTKLRCAEANF